MARPTKANPKHQMLQQYRLLHCCPNKVSDPLFAWAQDSFFDPHDLLQVKYEMLRRVRVEAQPVASVARAFGFSRQAFYQAQAAFERAGFAGLLPDKRGPRTAHKMSTPVVEFVRQQRLVDPSASSTKLARAVLQRFGLSVHPRSVERAVSRAEKKTS